MKSPFTGKEMTRTWEKRTWDFRGEKFEFMHMAWLCEDTGESFTTDQSDTASYIQVTNQYRAKYGIPYTDEIISIRKKYNLSAAKMSLLLGIGINQYRKYEQGEVPSVSNGRLIRSIMNPKVMLDMIESTKEELEEKRNTLENVLKAITSMTKAKEAINEIEEKLTPGIYGNLDGDLSTLEDLKLILEARIERLEEEQEYYEMNPQWRKERQQQEKEYWNTRI